ncbi:hypothetical protein C2W62_35460 [Candidatus Entotheonella serta]|nr:hypothetical protein C2W62_35460 [Candidatus Entotheonella serta]
MGWINRCCQVKRAAAAPPPRIGTLQEVERDHILQVLEDTAWRIEGPQGAAVRLGVNPSTLRSRIKKLNLVKP